MFKLSIELSIVIPNWNGESFITRCISSLDISAKLADVSYEIIVVDDKSDDKSIEKIKSCFPNIKLIENKENLGFVKSCNLGIEKSNGKLIALSNNDIVVRQDYISKMLRHFKDDKVFAVSAKTVDWFTNEPNHLCMNGDFQKGEFVLRYSDPDKFCETKFFQGGSCILKKDMFQELGGFNELFYPGYWEDYDIAYKAYKRGYKIIYEPESVALHLGKSSFRRRYGDDYINILIERNRFIFMWLNMNRADAVKHFFLLSFNLTKNLLKGERNTIKGFIKALPKYIKTFKKNY